MLQNVRSTEIIDLWITGNTITFSDAVVDASDTDSMLVRGTNAGTLTLALDTSAVNSARDVVIGQRLEVTLADGVNNRVVGDTAVNNSIAGGTGNDTIQFSSTAFDTNDSVDGNAGTDTIHFTSVAGGVTETLGANIIQVEQLTLQDGSNYTITLNNIGAPDSWTPPTYFAASNPWFRIDGSSLTGSNALNLDATAEDDRVHAIGGVGGDTLLGGSGVDYLVGGTGDDIIKANGGIDQVVFDSADVTSVWGGTSADIINFFTGTYTFDGTVFREFEEIRTNFVTDVSLTVTDAYRTAGGGAATFYVNSQAAVINITLNATALTTIGVSVTGGAHATGDALTLTNQADTVQTGSGNDTIIAGGGNDTIDAGANDDVIQFSSANFDANDTVAGGANSDTVQFTTAASVVDAAFANKTTVERLLLGDFNAQTLTLAANAQAAGITSVDGSAVTGTNTVSVDASAYTVAISITGGTGNDTLRSGTGSDTIVAGTGNDSIDAGADDDTIRMSINYTTSDSITGGTGVDTIMMDSVAGGVTATFGANVTGVEKVTLQDGSNYTFTVNTAIGSPDNWNPTGTASTWFNIDGSGLTGTNWLNVNNGLNINTYFQGGSGNDSFGGSAVGGVDSIVAGDGNDTILGRDGNDTIRGGNGDDSINGGSSNDRIYGDAGVDTLTGSGNNDIFFYTATTDSGTGVGNRDIITDFVSGTDDIDLSAFAGGATFQVGGNGAADLTGSVFQVAFQQSGGNTIVYVDTDGDNAANFEIQLTGLIALVAGDFVL